VDRVGRVVEAGGSVGEPELGTAGSPRSPRQDRRHGSGGCEEHGDEDDSAPAVEPHEVRGEEVQRDCHGERVHRGEAAPVVLLVRSGGALAEEHHGERADGGRHDGEHDEERGRVVGEERGAGVDEDGGAEADVALEQAGDGAPAPAEVADAGDSPRRGIAGIAAGVGCACA
jgi:hypothetical protein